MSHFLKTVLCLLALSVLQIQAAPNYEYRLSDSKGNIITHKDFPHQYQLIAFGFTHCPDVCPTTLFEFQQILAKSANPERLQPIFITIDPHRDTPELLNKYTSYFDPRILALSGTPQAIDEAVANFNATYGYQFEGKNLSVAQLPQDKYYNVFHSTMIYLLDKEGKLLDIFDYQSGHQQLLNDIEASISAHER